MKGNGNMESPRAEGSFYILTARFMRGIGLTTCRKGRARRPGLTEQFLKELFNRELSLDSGNLTGQMGRHMLESF